MPWQFRPRHLPLKKALQLFIEHRQNIITRRTQFELEKARARAHILEGLKIAVDNIDEVIKVIRGAEDTPQASEQHRRGHEGHKLGKHWEAYEGGVDHGDPIHPSAGRGMAAPRPILASASGLAYLAFCPDEQREAILDILAKSLKAHGFNASPIHGDLDQRGVVGGDLVAAESVEASSASRATRSGRRAQRDGRPRRHTSSPQSRKTSTAVRARRGKLKNCDLPWVR